MKPILVDGLCQFFFNLVRVGLPTRNPNPNIQPRKILPTLRIQIIRGKIRGLDLKFSTLFMILVSIILCLAYDVTFVCLHHYGRMTKKN